jgi:NitT/TauT family transport system ATP-binding protein
VYLGERVLMLSASPTVVQDELRVDLPADRDQLHTRADPRFTTQRAHVYEQIQRAKKGTASGAAGELSIADR